MSDAHEVPYVGPPDQTMEMDSFFAVIVLALTLYAVSVFVFPVTGD